MLIDLPNCIWCGNCVRACQAENDVPDGYFRTWVKRHHVSDYDIENLRVDSPDGGKKGFPLAQDEGGKLLCAQALENSREGSFHNTRQCWFERACGGHN